MSSGALPLTSASKLLIMKFELSMNFRFPSEKERYFSVLFGIQLISPYTRAMAWNWRFGV